MSRFGMLHNCDLSQEEDFRYAMESAELAYAETSASEPHNPDASADVIGGHESTPNVGYDASTSAETFETSDGGVSLQAKAAKAFLAASFSQQIYPSTLGQPNSTPGNEISWGNESEEHTIWGYSVSSGSPGLYIGTQQAIPEAFMSDESLQRIIDINRMVEEDYVGGMDNPWSAVDTKVPNTIADQTNEAANFNDAAGLGDMGVMNGSWSVVGTEDSNTIAGGTNQDGVGIWQAWDEPANLMDHPHTTCLTEDEFAPLLGRFEPTQTLDYGVETRVFEQGEHTQSAEQIVSTQDVNQDEPEQAINSDNQAQNIDPSLAAPQTTAYTTLYSSYEAAMEAKAENGLVGGNAPVDDTIPVTAAEDRVVVGRLFQAISNTTNTRDWTPTDMTKKPKPPHALKKFMDGTYEREKVELLAWDILAKCKEKHRRAPPVVQGQRTKKEVKLHSFANTITDVCEALMLQKTICKRLFDPVFLDVLVDNPKAQLLRASQNKTLNANKAVQIKNGRKAAGVEEADGAKGNGKRALEDEEAAESRKRRQK